MLKKESKLRALGRKLGFKSRGKASATTAVTDATGNVPAAAALSDPQPRLGPRPPSATTTTAAQPVNPGLKVGTADITIATVTAEVYHYGAIRQPPIQSKVGVEVPVPAGHRFDSSAFTVGPDVEKHLTDSRVVQPIVEQQELRQLQPDHAPRPVPTPSAPVIVASKSPGDEAASQHQEPAHAGGADKLLVVKLEQISTPGGGDVVTMLHPQPGETAIDEQMPVQAPPSSSRMDQPLDTHQPTDINQSKLRRDNAGIASTALYAKSSHLGLETAATVTVKTEDRPVIASPPPVSVPTTPAAAPPHLPVADSPPPKLVAPPPSAVKPVQSVAEAVRTTRFTLTANAPLSIPAQQVEGCSPPEPVVSAHRPEPALVAPPPAPIVVPPPAPIVATPSPELAAPPPPEPTPVKYPTSLRDIPVELLQLVLFNLPTIRSLTAAARSCGPLFRAVKSARMLLATHVIKKQLPEGLFLAAFLAAKSASLDVDQDRDTRIMNFIDRYLRQRDTATWRVTLAEARWITHFQQIVDYFSNAHLSFALRHLKGEMPRRSAWSNVVPWSADPTISPISTTEYARSARSFYLFETYRNLFRHYSNFVRIPASSSLATMQTHFFNSFSPWEIEQLATAMNYLAFSVIAPGT